MGNTGWGSWTLQLMSKDSTKDMLATLLHTTANFSANNEDGSIPLPQRGEAPMAL